VKSISELHAMWAVLSPAYSFEASRHLKTWVEYGKRRQFNETGGMAVAHDASAGTSADLLMGWFGFPKHFVPEVYAFRAAEGSSASAFTGNDGGLPHGYEGWRFS